MKGKEENARLNGEWSGGLTSPCKGIVEKDRGIPERKAEAGGEGNIVVLQRKLDWEKEEEEMKRDAGEQSPSGLP